MRERRWHRALKMIARGTKQKNSALETCPSATLFTTNPTWAGLVFGSDLRARRLSSRCHGHCGFVHNKIAQGLAWDWNPSPRSGKPHTKCESRSTAPPQCSSTPTRHCALLSVCVSFKLRGVHVCKLGELETWTYVRTRKDKQLSTSVIVSEMYPYHLQTQPAKQS